jgi:hypothetical protein
MATPINLIQKNTTNYKITSANRSSFSHAIRQPDRCVQTGEAMTASIGSTASNQSMEVLGAVMANKQQKQEAKMTMQLLQSAAASAPPPVAVGNIGQNINIKV